jgi:hypothetical protein
VRALAIAAVLAFTTGCGILRTNPETGETEVDYAALRRELELSAADARSLADAFDAAEAPEDAERMRTFAQTLDVAAGLVGEGGPGDLQSALALAIDSLDELADAFSDDPRAAVYVAGAQMVLRRAQAYSQPPQ